MAYPDELGREYIPDPDDYGPDFDWDGEENVAIAKGQKYHSYWQPGSPSREAGVKVFLTTDTSNNWCWGVRTPSDPDYGDF